MWIEKLENGKFKYIERVIDPYTDKPKKLSITLEKDSPQAKKQALALLNSKIDKVIHPQTKSAKITLKMLYDEWIERYEKTVKPRSVMASKNCFHKVFTEIDSGILISKIDKKMLLNFFDKIYIFGEYSYNYSIQIRLYLYSIFEYAIEHEYVSKNPVKEIKFKKKVKDQELSKQKLENKYLEKSEVKQIIEFLNNDKTFIYAMIVEFLYLTGLRFGELQSLQWADFNGTSISVNSTLSLKDNKNKFHKATPKTIASIRTVDLPNRAIEILNELKKINLNFHGDIKDDDFIFILTNKSNPIALSSVNLKLRQAQKELKIEKRLTSHIFRHSHVSFLAENNIPIKSIMERIGHSDSETTLKIYNHVTKKSKDRVLEALNNLN